MDTGNNKHRLLIENLPDAFAYHQLVTDIEGKPVDYIFLEVNRAFEEMTGLTREDVLGRKVTEVLPGIELSNFDWIAAYGQVALTDGSTSFEAYSEPLGRWYAVTAYSDEPEYFATVFRDITSSKKEKKNLEKLMTSVQKNLQEPVGELDYQNLTDDLLQLSGAKFVAINTYEEEGTKTITRAISGMAKSILKASEVMGFELTGKEWDIIPERVQSIKDGRLLRFENLYDAGSGAISKQVSFLLEKLFGLGEIYVMEIAHQGQSLGDFIIFMSRGQQIYNPEIVELYANQAGIMLLRKKAEQELSRSEQKYRLIFENSPLGILHFDREGTITSCNDNFVEIIGSSQEALLGLNMLNLLDKKLVAAVQETLDGGRGFYEDWYYSVTVPKVTPVRALFAPFATNEGYIDGGVGIVEDIAERKHAEEVLKESEEKFRTLFDQNLLAIYLHDFEGNIFDVNRQASLLLGYSYEELLEMSVFDFIYTKESGGYLSKEEILHIWHQMDVGERTTVEDVHQRKDGTIFYVEVSTGVIYYNNENMIMALVKDITERKRAEEKIKYMSFHDALTELYNRYYLNEEMHRLDTERQLPITITMVDFNGLKMINDAYGHETGDEMLKSAAGIIKNSCRSKDIVCRWGGDEFVILMPQTPEEEVEKIHRRIKDNCRGVLVKDVPVSLALGSGTKESTEKNLEAVLKEAEDNMYKQKLSERKSTRSSVLNTMIKTLQAKSYETEEHTTRMVNMAWKIGEKIGLADTELNRLNLVITLHDIGKINIPETILTKEGALTDEEWKIIKTHPEVGYRITRASEEFAHVSEDILAHHERWDGQGYPQGLKEKEIPLLARITTIVDAYDVMSNGRPYKNPMSQEEIIKELKRCAGTQFDPELVEVFLSVLEE